MVWVLWCRGRSDGVGNDGWGGGSNDGEVVGGVVESDGWGFL